MTIFIDGPDQVLYQWDKGQRIMLHGVPDGVRVDFALCGSDKAVSVELYTESGVVFCDIPDALLMGSGQLHGYIYKDDADRGETIFSFVYQVIPRPKPDDYVEPEEVLLWHELDRRISELEENGVSEDKIAAAVDKYLKENPPESGVQFETDDTLRLENGILSVNTADRAEQDNTLPITSAAVHTQLGNIETLLKTI